MNQENQEPVPGIGPVPPQQIEQLCCALASEPDPAQQRQYWSLLQQSAPSSKALDLALECLMNPSAPNRGEAIRYLHLCFPDRLPGLLDSFARDPDEEVRYQLSEFMRDSDQDAAVGMKIGILKNASPALQEALIKEIAEQGNLWHLEGLQGLDQLEGGNSVFARAAELLAKRTRSQASSGGN